MTGLQGMPSLGKCVVCDGTFTIELITNSSIRTAAFDGIEGEFCVHDRCIPILEKANEEGWETLPEGTLRRGYAEVDAKQQKAQEDSPDADTAARIGNNKEGL